MINHRCTGCGHWVQSSDHLIGMAVPCRECGEPLEVPAKSAPNVPNAAQPSGVLRPTMTLVDNTPDDPLDQGPVEAGWRRLQEMVPKTSLLLGALLLVGLLIFVALGWWLSHR
jgi:hypothetical protein